MFTNLRQPTRWIGLFIVYVMCAALLLRQDELQDNRMSLEHQPAVAVSQQAIASDAAAHPFEEKQVYLKIIKRSVTATGYTAGPESTGKDIGHPEYGITYSGVKVRRSGVSTIAADPAVFPIGTILYIPDYGYGVVADTGSAIKGNKIDLFFETKEDVYSLWGKKNVQVLVIREGAGKLSEQTVNELDEKVSESGHLLDLLLS